MRAAAGQDQYALRFGNFVNQQPIWRVELPWSARRQTPRVRIALALLCSPNLVQSSRPGHERDFTDIQICRKVIAVLSKDRSCAGIPITELTRRRAQHGVSIGVSWSRL